MRHGSLFSGIGGFDLAAEWMGWQNVFHCEWNTFGQKVLKYYWPKSITYNDITQTDFSIHRGKIDILTGGFPCQPYSTAGKRLGKGDSRHLWPEMLRAIREIEPRWIVGENVRGLISWNGGMVFDEVQSDLEAAGYSVRSFVLPAVSVNAPHRRDRIWFVAWNAKGNRIHWDGKIGEVQKGKGSNTFGIFPNVSASHPNDTGAIIGVQSEREREDGDIAGFAQFEPWKIGGDGNAADTSCIRGGEDERKRNGESNVINEIGKTGAWDKFPTQSPICVRDDGISDRLDGITFPKWRNESIKAAGNAIVPQVVFQIFKAIEQYEQLP